MDVSGLDSAFHALFASEDAGVADMPMKRMLPVRFGFVRSFVPGAIAVYAVARTVRQSPTSMLVDIDLVDTQGNVLHSCSGVRLIEAPSELAIDPRSIGYRISQWQHDRAHKPSRTLLPDEPRSQLEGNVLPEAASLAEALLLLEAGCLKASWSLLKSDSVATEPATPAEADQRIERQPFLRSALLWHLESRGLAVESEGAQVLAAECDLPEVSSIVRSLSARHPTMAIEAAALSRIEEFLGEVVASDPSASSKFNIVPWRHLESASNQLSILRAEIAAIVAVTPHICTAQLLPLMKVPLIDMVSEVAELS